ncbi:MAG: class I SAM-dependent methyltransferase [Ardenticatenaceae bacterium]
MESVVKSSPECSLLDIGGASGEFSYYLKKRFSHLDVTALDYDQKLVEHGKAKVGHYLHFVQGDANRMDMFHDLQFDLVTMIGVLSIFDDFTLSLSECIRLAQKKVFVVAQFNEYPIDALIRWRYSGDQSSYNRGYNLFSKKSIGSFLAQHDRVSKWGFNKFELPFDLPQRPKDLIRSWTELDKEGGRIFRNGLMIINLEILTIDLL